MIRIYLSCIAQYPAARDIRNAHRPTSCKSFSRQVGHLSRRFSDQLGNLSDGYGLSLDVVSII
jgi:hypothetical protein